MTPVGRNVVSTHLKKNIFCALCSAGTKHLTYKTSDSSRLFHPIKACSVNRLIRPKPSSVLWTQDLCYMACQRNTWHWTCNTWELFFSSSDISRGGQRFVCIYTYISWSDADGCYYLCYRPLWAPAQQGPCSFSKSEKAELTWVNSSSWHWFLCLAAKEVVLFVTGIKACNYSAVVAEREFSCSGDESSPTAVLSGCSFQPVRKTAHTAFCHQRWGINLSLALQANL